MMPQFKHGLFDWRVQQGQEGYKPPAAPRPPPTPVSEQFQRFISQNPAGRTQAPAPDVVRSFTVLPSTQLPTVPGRKLPIIINGVEFSRFPNAAEQAAIAAQAKGEKIESAKHAAVAATLAIFSLVPFAEVSPFAAKALGRKGLAFDVEKTALGTRVRPTRFALLYAAPAPLGVVPPEEYGLPPDYLSEVIPGAPKSTLIATEATAARAQAFALQVRREELHRQAFLVGNTYDPPQALAFAEAVQSGRYGVLTPEERVAFVGRLREGIAARPRGSVPQPILDALDALPSSAPVEPSAVKREDWRPITDIPPGSAAGAEAFERADEIQKQLLIVRADP